MFKWFLILCIGLITTLSAEINVLAFAGSTREDSLNKKLVTEAADLAEQAGAHIIVIDLRDYPIPLYDGDLDEKEGIPANAKLLRQLMIQSQVILISSPDYNGSVSAVLKNAIDWATRSEANGPSREAFKGKKFALMSASPSASGGAKGLTHLRDIIQNIGGTVIPKQVTIPKAYDAFDEQGRLKDQKLQTELQELIQAVMK